jgi:pimeloyl-ACP methyl ester carboxylesterase
MTQAHATVTVTERWLDWDGMRYRVWERPVPGSTMPPLVLLHGYASCVEQWARLIRDIGPDIPVYAVDRIGYGQASKPKDAPYGGAFFLAQLEHMRAAYGWRRVIPVGHSAGGLLGILWAAARPDVVASVVAIAPGTLYQDQEVAEPIRRLLALISTPTVVRAVYPIIAHLPYRVLAALSYADFAAIDHRTRHAIQAAMRDPGAMWSHSSPFCYPERYRVSPETLSLPCPVHLLRGAKDRMVTIAEMDRYAQQFPHATVTTLEGGGHCVHEERAREVAAEVRALLALDGFLGSDAPFPLAAD